MLHYRRESHLSLLFTVDCLFIDVPTLWHVASMKKLSRLRNHRSNGLEVKSLIPAVLCKGMPCSYPALIITRHHNFHCRWCTSWWERGWSLPRCGSHHCEQTHWYCIVSSFFKIHRSYTPPPRLTDHMLTLSFLPEESPQPTWYALVLDCMTRMIWSDHPNCHLQSLGWHSGIHRGAGPGSCICGDQGQRKQTRLRRRMFQQKGAVIFQFPLILILCSLPSLFSSTHDCNFLTFLLTPLLKYICLVSAAIAQMAPLSSADDSRTTAPQVETLTRVDMEVLTDVVKDMDIEQVRKLYEQRLNNANLVNTSAIELTGISGPTSPTEDISRHPANFQRVEPGPSGQNKWALAIINVRGQTLTLEAQVPAITPSVSLPKSPSFALKTSSGPYWSPRPEPQ